jgi:TolB-like protein
MPRIALIFLLITFSVAGCAAIGDTVRYVNPEADFSFIKKVAVLPFNNMSADRFAGEKVRSALSVDLMARGVFEIVEEGEVSKAVRLILRGVGAEEGAAVEVTKETLKTIGERLGVQAVILGNVEEYGISVGGTAATVTISLRMLDVNSAIVLWQVRTTASGKSLWRSVLGIEVSEMSALTRKATRKALDTLL